MALGSFFFGKLQYPLEMRTVGMLLEELEVLADEPVREAGGNAGLVERESFFVEQDNTGKVLDIAFDSRLGMMSSSLNLGELIAGEVKIEDLGFVCLSSSQFVSPTPGRDNDTLATDLAQVTLDGDDACGQSEGDIFIGKNTALIDGFVGDPNDFVLSQAAQARLFVNGEILLGPMESELDRKLFAQGNRLSPRLIFIDRQIMNLSYGQIKLGMPEKIDLDLIEVGFGQDRSEVEILGQARNNRSLN